MSEKYYWIIDGKYYEVSKETYQKYKKEHDHSKMLQEYEQEVHVYSLDAMTAEDIEYHEIIADPNVNVEEEAIHNLLLKKLESAKQKLSSDERLLIELLYDQNLSQEEVEKITGIPQTTVSYRHKKLIKKFRKMFGIKNN